MHHYFVTEALIVISALFFGLRLVQRQKYLAAMGIALFGLAAAIGVYRFGFGKISELADVHKMAGQIGGLAGMSLIASEFVREKQKRLLVLFLAFVCLVIAYIKPGLSVPLFLLWSLLVIAGTFISVEGSKSRKIKWTLGASLMLFAVIFVRRSPFLGPEMAWHAFHSLVTIWIIVIATVFFKKPY